MKDVIVCGLRPRCRIVISSDLAEKQVGYWECIGGTVGELRDGQITLSGDRPAILSPFGMGILDMTVGECADDRASVNNDLIQMAYFFYVYQRW